MGTLVFSGAIKNAINYNLVYTNGNNQTEGVESTYERVMSDGTGSLQANYGVISSGSLSSGNQLTFDFSSLDKDVFGSSTNISFTKIKSVTVENKETVFGNDINVHATGSNALTELFNGESGNLLVKPYSVYQYSDPMSGVTIDGTNKELTIFDAGGNGLDWSMTVIGVTG